MTEEREPDAGAEELSEEERQEIAQEGRLEQTEQEEGDES